MKIKAVAAPAINRDGDEAGEGANALKQKPCRQRTQRCGDADCGADGALRQIETAGARSQVSDDDGGQDADDGAADTIEQLRRDQKAVTAGEGQERSPQRLGGEADEQERFAAALFGMIADPRGKDRDDDLRHDDQPGGPDRRRRCGIGRQVFADQRQHRRIGELKQHQRGGEQHQPVVLRQIEHAADFNVLPRGRIAGTRVVDLVGR
jgi:hypothetical protein